MRTLAPRRRQCLVLSACIQTLRQHGTDLRTVASADSVGARPGHARKTLNL
jgi:hypothetical protein